MCVQDKCEIEASKITIVQGYKISMTLLFSQN